jgi:hypothetical protein
MMHAMLKRQDTFRPAARPHIQPKLMVGAANDRQEAEADRVADAVVNGAPFAVGATSHAGNVRRDPPPAPPQAGGYSEGLQKLGEAFLKTQLGKQLVEAAERLGNEFIATLPGKIIAGTAAAAAVGELAREHKALPAQPPAIPLDFVTPGLKAQLRVEGPIDHPSAASITFSIPLGGAPAAPRQRPDAGAAYRAETARMRAEMDMFRPRTPDDSAMAAYNQQKLREATERLVPGLRQRPAGTAAQPEKKDEGAVQRKAAGPDGGSFAAPAAVEGVLSAGGEQLPHGLQSRLSARFGCDFSGVRVHTDDRAAASATAIGARAYTYGNHVVFARGQYSPVRREGQWLLAHELAHVAQQAPPPRALHPKIAIGRSDDPREREADRIADRVIGKDGPDLPLATMPLQISRKCDACEEEEKQTLRMKRAEGCCGNEEHEAPEAVHEVVRSPGRPLDATVRAFFEPRFGRDLSSVRVHADEKAALSALSIDARAYTVGDHIVSGDGEFASAIESRRLLAHELTHVMQQRGAARTVQREPLVAPGTGATRPTGKKPDPPKAVSSSFNSYVDLFNGFQDLAAAAINRGGAGLDSARFGADLSASHRSLLSRVRMVLIQAQERDKEQRLAAAAAWPALAAKVLAAVSEATRMQFAGEVLAAVTDDIAMLGRKYVHARAGKAEPEVESFDDYADTIRGMSELLWIFGRVGEAGEGLIREEVPNRRETVVSSGVIELNAKQRAALAKVEFGSHLNARHAKVLDTLRTLLLLARSEAPGSAYKALTLWRSIHGDLQHVLARAPVYQVQFDISGVQGEIDATAQVLANHYATVHQENVGVALTQPRAPARVKAERAMAKAAGPVLAAGMKEARAVEDFRYALTIIEQHLTPSTNRPGEWILTSSDTVIRVRADQVQSLRATVARELRTYMAQLVKAMVRVWQTYDSIQRGNSTFKLAVLGGWGGATDPGDQAHFKDSLIRVRDERVYPLIEQQKYVEAFQWIMVQKGVVDRQANEVGDYDSDLDLGYSRLATAANVVQMALVSIVPAAGEVALARASIWGVAGTAIAAGGGGAGAAETARQLWSGEDLDPRKIGKATYSGALVGAAAVAPAATKGLGKFIAPGEVGTTAVGANAFAAGTVGAIQSKLGGGDAFEGFAGGFLGSIAGSAASQVLGPMAKSPVAKTAIEGVIGAGTAAATGGDPIAGAAGGIVGALASHGTARAVPTAAAAEPHTRATGETGTPEPHARPTGEAVAPERQQVELQAAAAPSRDGTAIGGTIMETELEGRPAQTDSAQKGHAAESARANRSAPGGTASGEKPDAVRARFHTPDGQHTIFVLADGRIFRCSALCAQMRAWYDRYLQSQPEGTRRQEAGQLDGELQKLEARTRAGENNEALNTEIARLNVAMRDFIAPDLSAELDRAFEARGLLKPGERLLSTEQARNLLQVLNLDDVLLLACEHGFSTADGMRRLAAGSPRLLTELKAALTAFQTDANAVAALARGLEGGRTDAYLIAAYQRASWLRAEPKFGAKVSQEIIEACLGATTGSPEALNELKRLIGAIGGPSDAVITRENPTGLTDNCGFCAIAYELNSRGGQDVTAEQLFERAKDAQKRPDAKRTLIVDLPRATDAGKPDSPQALGKKKEMERVTGEGDAGGPWTFESVARDESLHLEPIQLSEFASRLTKPRTTPDTVEGWVARYEQSPRLLAEHYAQVRRGLPPDLQKQGPTLNIEKFEEMESAQQETLKEAVAQAKLTSPRGDRPPAASFPMPGHYFIYWEGASVGHYINMQVDSKLQVTGYDPQNGVVYRDWASIQGVGIGRMWRVGQ